jgi:lysophospholipase L1-like esterase
VSVFFPEANTISENTIRVACVGDSITCDTEYPEVLSTMLGANYTVKDFGVGRTTVSLDFNKPYMRQVAFYDAQNFDPDIVVIMLGTNDGYLSQQQRSSFTDDYETLVSSFQVLPSSPQIHVVIPPPVFDNTMGLPAEVIDDEVVPLVNQTAIGLELPTIDIYTPLLDKPENFEDGVHPNLLGSQVIASEIYNAIN